MNLIELYKNTPVDQHENIIVDGNKVYVLPGKGKPFIKLYLIKDNDLILLDNKEIQ